MENGVRQRIIDLLANYGMTVNSMSKGDKATQRRMNRQINEGAAITSETITSILDELDNISAEWLLTGKGEMLKNFGVSVGNNNKGDIANNSSRINKNKINVSLPESGTQKIIRPDSTIELTSSDSSNLELESIKKDNEALRLQISHLKDNIATKDELIASLKETIELLKHRQ